MVAAQFPRESPEAADSGVWDPAAGCDVRFWAGFRHVRARAPRRAPHSSQPYAALYVAGGRSALLPNPGLSSDAMGDPPDSLIAGAAGRTCGRPLCDVRARLFRARRGATRSPVPKDRPSRCARRPDPGAAPRCAKAARRPVRPGVAGRAADLRLEAVPDMIFL